MRLATVRTTGGTRAVRLDDDRAVETGHADVGALLTEPDWRLAAAAGDGPVHDRAALDHAPLVPRPGKLVCAGVNHGVDVPEAGGEAQELPTLSAEYAEALVGAYDDIVLPPGSAAVDGEPELAVVVGTTVRHADLAAAEAAIAGYAVLNDVTARDWQYRTLQWLQGKTFEATTPLGPELVTPDEAGTGLELTCAVDGETVQSATTADLVLGPAAAIAYVSSILTLRPGDVIGLGIPGGVGHGRTPRRYLTPGAVLTTAIAGLGECRNVCVEEER